MIWVLGYLGVGFLFWARIRFGYEFLQRRDWKELKRDGGSVEHVNERNWGEWVGSGVICLLFWFVIAAIMIFIGLSIVAEWILEKVVG